MHRVCSAIMFGHQIFILSHNKTPERIPTLYIKKKMRMAQCNKGARFTLVLVGQLIQGNGLPYAVAWQTCTKSFFFLKSACVNGALVKWGELAYA